MRFTPVMLFVLMTGLPMAYAETSAPRPPTQVDTAFDLRVLAYKMRGDSFFTAAFIRYARGVMGKRIHRGYGRDPERSSYYFRDKRMEQVSASLRWAYAPDLLPEHTDEEVRSVIESEAVTQWVERLANEGGGQ